jgi:anti-sigma regulatory factor (Ser/Thr protein kinase)
MSSPDPSDQPTTLQLVLPADPRMLRVLRLVASGVASLGPFDLEAVEEVRVAVDELGSALIGASGGAPISLTFELSADALSVDASTEHPGPLEIDPLTDRMLDVVASSHSWTSADGVVHGRIEKQVRSA